MTNTTPNENAVVEELIKDIKKTCEGINEIGYIIETCNSLFTYYTDIKDVYEETYVYSGNYYLDIYGDDKNNKFNDLILQIELIEDKNCDYEIYDVYEKYTH